MDAALASNIPPADAGGRSPIQDDLHDGPRRRTGVIAKKVGMTRVFAENGDHVAVTVFSLEECQVVSHRTPERNGYSALQLGAGRAKVKNVPQPERGHFAVARVEPKREVREFCISRDAYIPVGAFLSADHFLPGQFVDVSGTSKGKGFAGGMKRCNFGGLRASHGVSVSHRSIGSTGGRQDPGRTFKNKGMPGQLGNERVTVQNLRVHSVNVERGLLLVAGAVPGPKETWVEIRDAVKRPPPGGAPFPGRFALREPEEDNEEVVLSLRTGGNLQAAGKPVGEPLVVGLEPFSESSPPPTENPHDEADAVPEPISESRLMEAFGLLSAVSESEREQAVTVLMLEGLKYLHGSAADRGTTKRVLSITPALFAALFDPAASVQRKAAFAICALRHPERYAKLASRPIPEDVEKSLLEDLQQFLVDAKAGLFSNVGIVSAESIGNGRTRYQLVAEVTDSLPLTLGGRHPKTQRPAWVSVKPELNCLIELTLGATATKPAPVSTEALAAVAFSVDAPSEPGANLYVNLVLDRHSLERHHVPLGDAPFPA